MDWTSVGGDPAPGDPPGIRTIARRYDQVSRNAEDAKVALEGLRRDADGSLWKGDAADRFAAELDGDVLDNLRKLQTSYALASATLEAYAATLERIQQEARDQLGLARGAVHDEDRATGRVQDRDRARQALADALRRQQGHLGALRRRYNDPAYADPANAAALAELNSAYRETQSRIGRTSADLRVVEGDVRRAEGERDDARARLRRARERVAELRTDRSAAVERAKRGIDRAAEEGIRNKRWWQKPGEWFRAAFKWITNLDNLQLILDGLALLCTIGAAILLITGVGAPLAAALFATSRVLGGVSLAITVTRVIQGKRSVLEGVVQAGLTLIGGKAAGGLLSRAARPGGRLVSRFGLSSARLLKKGGSFGFARVVAGHSGGVLPSSWRSALIRGGRTALRDGGFPFRFPNGAIRDIARRSWPSLPIRGSYLPGGREWAIRRVVEHTGEFVVDKGVAPTIERTIVDPLQDRFLGSRMRQGSLPWTRECGR